MTIPLPRRGLLALLTLAAAVTAVLLAAAPLTPAHADDGDALRSAGSDRFATAAQISRDLFDPTGVDTVYVATGGEFADALAAGSTAALAGSPVLLATDHVLPGATADELDRLSPERIIIAGGQAAISDEVADELSAYADTVERIDGANRFSTAAALATEQFDADEVDVVYLANGGDFADALASVSTAARYDAPLLLTTHDDLLEVTAEALAALDPDRVVLAGGTAALSFGVQQAVADIVDEVDRHAGANRWATAATLATEEFSGAREVFIATGLAFPDAVAGGAGAAHVDAPMLLVPGDDLIGVVADAIATLNPRTVRVLGGSAAVTPEVARDAADVERTALAPGETPHFAMMRGQLSPRHIQSVAVGVLDGRAEELTNPTSDEIHINAQFSPDGQWLAYERRLRGDGDPEGEVQALNVDEGSASRTVLSDGDGRNCGITGLRWNPDGDTVAFVCIDADDDDRRTVGLATLDGEVTWLDAGDDAEYRGADFGADGELYLAVSDDDGAQLVEVDVDDPSGDTEVLASVDEGHLVGVRASPEADLLAAEHVRGSDRFRRDTDASMLVVDLDAGDVAELLGDDDGDNELDQHELMGWHPGGEQLLVATGGHEGSGNSTLRLVSVDDDTDQHVVVGDGGQELEENTILRADVSPDGEMVIYDDVSYSSSSGLFNVPKVFVADLDTGERIAVPGLGDPAFPTWNPAAEDLQPPEGEVSSQCYDAPEGTTRDGANEEVDEPRADITEVCVDYGADEIDLRTKVVDPVDPLTDDSWAGDPAGPDDTPRTSILYGISTTGGEPGTAADYWVDYRYVEFEGDQEWIEVEVVREADNTIVCSDESEGAFDDDWYVATLDPSACFDDPDSIAVGAQTVYRTGTDAQDYAYDRHPGGDGFLAPVVAP